MMKLFILAFILCSQAFAGLPPTTSKGSSDANPVTTFEIDFPSAVVSHVGTRASVAIGTNPLAPLSVQILTSGTTYNKDYTFVITSGNATIGATYTDSNSHTYTVYATVASATQVVMSGGFVPATSGTLTKTGGTGDATLTYSQALAPILIKVTVIGGGGGGGGTAGGTGSGAAAGGGAGGIVIQYISSPATTYSYTIGSAGTAGAAGNNAGGTGGASTFNAGALSGGGGSPGSGSAAAITTVTKTGDPGAGGTATGGNIQEIGNQGFPGVVYSLTAAVGGNGGSTPFGGGGAGGVNAAAGTAGGGFGAGGGGGATDNAAAAKAGGAGGAGAIIVEEYYQ